MQYVIIDLVTPELGGNGCYLQFRTHTFYMLWRSRGILSNLTELSGDHFSLFIAQP